MLIPFIGATCLIAINKIYGEIQYCYLRCAHKFLCTIFLNFLLIVYFLPFRHRTPYKYNSHRATDI